MLWRVLWPVIKTRVFGNVMMKIEMKRQVGAAHDSSCCLRAWVGATHDSVTCFTCLHAPVITNVFITWQQQLTIACLRVGGAVGWELAYSQWCA
jgi:hypothetical protein